MLSLIYIPTAYGAVTPGLNSENQEEDRRATLEDNLTKTELEEITEESILANQKRLAKEWEDMKRMMETYKTSSNNPK